MDRARCINRGIRVFRHERGFLCLAQCGGSGVRSVRTPAVLRAHNKSLLVTLGPLRVSSAPERPRWTI